MSDYKRLVSYMYNYENGDKGNNVGYARVEAINGQCKITIQIKIPSMNNNELKVFFFKRNGYSIEGIPLGSVSVRNGRGQFVASTDSNNIMNSSYELDDIGGIVLYYSDRKYIASEWDDKPITKEMVNASLISSKEAREEEFVKVADTEEEIKEVKDTKDIKEKLQEIVEKEEIDEIKISSDENKKKWEEKAVIDEVLINKVDTVEIEVAEEPTSTADVGVSEKFIKPEDKEASEEVTKTEDIEVSEEVTKTEDMEVSEEVTKTEDMEIFETLIKPEDIGKFATQEARIELEESIEETQADKLSQVATNIVNQGNQNKRKKRPWPGFEEHPEAFKIYNKYPKMYPFEDNEVAWCVRFEPQDIGVMPMENWSLGNNSFLLHGFYCYSHLIFARINDKRGIQYILGVPGIYHNREKFMAKMFGFEFFKSIKRKELRTGEFGYWYTPIYFN